MAVLLRLGKNSFVFFDCSLKTCKLLSYLFDLLVLLAKVFEFTSQQLILLFEPLARLQFLLIFVEGVSFLCKTISLNFGDV